MYIYFSPKIVGYALMLLFSENNKYLQHIFYRSQNIILVKTFFSYFILWIPDPILNTHYSISLSFFTSQFIGILRFVSYQSFFFSNKSFNPSMGYRTKTRYYFSLNLLYFYIQNFLSYECDVV